MYVDTVEPGVPERRAAHEFTGEGSTEGLCSVRRLDST